MLNRFVGRNTVFTLRFAAAIPSKLRGQNVALKMRGLEGPGGVVQGALKNIDSVKEVKGNLRAGSRAGGLGRADGEGGRLDGCEYLEAGFMFLCSSVCLMKRK